MTAAGDGDGRHALPLIAPGQAQKEMSHNEALTALDLLVQAAVEGVGVNIPPADPIRGQCWVAGTAPTGAWAEQPDALVGWTGGGWRFVAARAGMTVGLAGTAGFARYESGAWNVGALRGATLSLGGAQVVGARQPAITNPTGGATADSEARAALVAVLAALRTHGLIAT